MNHTLPVLTAIVCMLIVIPLSTAESLTSDVEISIADFDSMYINVTINNPDRKELSLTNIQFSLSDSMGHLTDRRRLSVKGNDESITCSIKNKIYNIDEFYRAGSKDITVSGLVSVEEGSNSFTVPFQKSTTIHPVTDGTNRVVDPELTDVKVEIGRLSDENGEIEVITITTNISIYNPNSVGLFLSELNYKISDVRKEGEELKTKKVILTGFYHTNQAVINSTDIYVYSAERRTSKIFFTDTFEYLVNEEPKYLKFEGSAILIPAKVGCNPNYFRSDFDTMITMNGSSGSSANGEKPTFALTPAPETINKSKNTSKETTVASTPTHEKNVPGFKAVFTTTALLLIVAVLLRRRK